MFSAIFACSAFAVVRFGTESDKTVHWPDPDSSPEPRAGLLTESADVGRLAHDEVAHGVEHLVAWSITGFVDG